MATSKSDKEKLKMAQEKCVQCLDLLLRDDDNKYCVDCDAKGPRWASWNLGVFLCIRCAGIHRNLGVHISKVKSINLDSWTPEQIGYLQQMGNSKARAVYEANLPDDFRRPQTDSSLEAFVRAKYEQKKYIAKEWTQPPTPPPAFDIDEERRKDKEKKRARPTAIIGPPKNGTNGGLLPSSDFGQNNSVPRPQSSPASTVISAEKVPKASPSGKGTSDLLGLSFGSPADPVTPVSVTSVPSSNNDDDFFAAFVSASSAPVEDNRLVNQAVASNGSSQNQAKSSPDEEADFFNQKGPIDTKMDLASILKLYDNAPVMAPVVGQSNNLFSPAPAASNHFGQFSAPSHVQNNFEAGASLFGGPTLSATGGDLFNQNSGTNPFLSTSTPPAPSVGGQEAPVGGSMLCDHFSGLMVNNQLSSQSTGNAGASDWNWAFSGTNGTTNGKASSLEANFANFNTAPPPPSQSQSLQQMPMVSAMNGSASANPFMSAGSLVAAGGPGGSFAHFSQPVAGLGTVQSSSSLDTLSWGGFASSKSTPATHDLWQ